MTGGGRGEILGRVRGALAGAPGGGMGAPGGAAPDAEAARVVSADVLPAQLAAMFAARIEALGDRVVLCASLADAWQIVLREAGQAGCRAGFVEPALASAFGVMDGGAAWPGGTVLTAPDHAAMFDCDLAVTRAAHGIAETGSLVFVHGPGSPRLGNVAPPVQYTVLEQRCLLADMVDALGHLAGVGADRQVVWITGSSRTADIEGVVVRGAHGPRALTVLLVAA